MGLHSYSWMLVSVASALVGREACALTCFDLDTVAVRIHGPGRHETRALSPGECVTIPARSAVRRLDVEVLRQVGRPRDGAGSAGAAPIPEGPITVIELLVLASGVRGRDVRLTELPRVVLIETPRSEGRPAARFRLSRSGCLDQLIEIGAASLQQHVGSATLQFSDADRDRVEACGASFDVGASILAGPQGEVVPLHVSFLNYQSPGGPPVARVVLGTVPIGGVSTPAQQFFRAGGPTALFAWSLTDEGLALAPRGPADLVDEAALAAAAGSLWWVRRGGRREPVALTTDGRFRTPDAALRETLHRRYGGVAWVAPTPEDRRDAVEDVDLCLADSYRAAESQRGFRCLPGRGLFNAATPEAPLVVRLGHGLRRLGHGLSETAEVSIGEAFSVSSGPAAETRWMSELATVGDRLFVEGRARRLALCIDGHCRGPDGDGSFVLDRPGIAELRHASDMREASTVDATTLVRTIVIDPLREWIPTGLATSPTRPEVPVWWQLPHDGPTTYAFRRGAQDLGFRWQSRSRFEPPPDEPRGDGGEPRTLTTAVPLESTAEGARRTPPASRLVALATTAERCPGGVPADVRRRLISPEGRALDDTFQVFLAEYRGEARPYRCLAVVRFRVRDPHAVASVRTVRLAMLGPPLLLAYVSPTSPGVGVGLPLTYLHAVLPAGFGADVSSLATASWSLESGALDRTGLAFAAALTWGPPGTAPRLLSVGTIAHVLQVDADGPRRPAVTPFVGLNLGALFEAVRPR